MGRSPAGRFPYGADVPALPLHVAPIDEPVGAGLAAIRAGMEVVDPPATAVAEAEVAIAAGPTPPASLDLTDIPFVTIDPAGSRDLDQALHVERDGTGWTVHYAVADVGAFVAPGGALDEAARARGVTLYLPDASSPLHPRILSEGAASLLPDQVRQALVWRVRLMADGEVRGVDVRRARVRSRAAHSYADVQAALDAGAAEDVFGLLRDAGRARQQLQADRGGLDLRLPEQEVVRADGGYQLVYRAPLPVEEWNAQMSLLVGECAARLMLDAGVGVLRTLPPPSPTTVDRLRRHAQALGVAWPVGAGYAEVVRRLDPRRPGDAALMIQSASLARGAGYLAFTQRPDGDVTHSAVAAPYAHVTAPLRRLDDRFANEVVLAACAGTEPPEWAAAALPDLPGLMGRASTRQRAVERMVVSLAEAAVLAGRIGDVLDGVVVDVDGNEATGAAGGSGGRRRGADRGRPGGSRHGDLAPGHRRQPRHPNRGVGTRPMSPEVFGVQRLRTACRCGTPATTALTQRSWAPSATATGSRPAHQAAVLHENLTLSSGAEVQRSGAAREVGGGLDAIEQGTPLPRVRDPEVVEPLKQARRAVDQLTHDGSVPGVALRLGGDVHEDAKERDRSGAPPGNRHLGIGRQLIDHGVSQGPGPARPRSRPDPHQVAPTSPRWASHHRPATTTAVGRLL